MWLSQDVFRQVVQATPLVAVDLVVQNAAGEILLGHRLNRPAQGTWFVPGGRILKNETFDTAFERLTLSELGQRLPRAQSTLLGVYEHFYADSMFGSGPNLPDSHYVVMAFRLPWSAAIAADKPLASLPLTQHSDFGWWALQEAAASNDVHPHTKAYLSALEKD